jgi:predicted lipoprotein DUF2279
MNRAYRLGGLLLLAAVLRPSAAAAGDGTPTGERSPTDERPPTDERTATVEPAARPHDYREVSLLGLGGAYVAFGAWTWVAWYRHTPRLPAWKLGGDGGFGRDTYAGGADKLGHAWTALVLTRLGSSLLDASGWNEAAASALASGLCLGALSLVEVNDGYYTEFSPGDLTADLAGVGAALVLRHIPGMDDALDFRVQWFPSREFRRHPGANFAEDYSGQTYLLAFKPRALAEVRDAKGALQTLQFLNPVIGFETRGYVGAPAGGERATHRQTFLLGLTLDVQAILDVASTSSSAKARVSADIGRTLFEYANLPFSTLRVVSASRQETVGVSEE